MSTNITHEADHGPGILSNAIAIIAFIVVIAIVIWGLLHLANISTSWFSSLFPRSNPTIQIAVPSSVESGAPVSVSWKYSGTEEGTFAFLYQCRTGVTLKDADGARVLCGTVHPLVNAASSTLVFTPVLSNVSSTTLPFSIIFMPASTSSKQVQGTATLALKGASGAAQIPVTQEPVVTVSTPVRTSSDAEVYADDVDTTTYTKPVSTYSAPASPADLRVRILSVSAGDLSTVQFDIANIGGSQSGSYTFTAYLPTTNGYVYASPVQVSLGAGSHVVNTLQFTDAASGDVTIVLQPAKSNDYAGNNTASEHLSAPYTATNYYDNSYTSGYGAYDMSYSYPQYQYDQYNYGYNMYDPYQYNMYDSQYYNASYGTYDYGYNQQYSYDTNYDSYYYPQIADETGYYPYYPYYQY